MSKKNNDKIPLYDLKISARSRKEILDTLKSGWLNTGPKVRQFEKEIAAFLKVKHTAAVNSCTLGLQLVLSALNPGGRVKVITTPFTFVATIEAILGAGAEPVLADIDPHTLNVDPDEIERKISDSTAAMVSVDIAGWPSDYARLNEICDATKLPLVVDAAHAFGTLYRGRSIPRLCDAAVYSFHSTKNLTCGEGGMVVSRHKALIEKVKTISLHGLTSTTLDRKKNKSWSYDVVDFGYKANMSELHAAVGLGQLSVFEKDQRQREKLAGRYLKNLASLDEYFELPPTDTKNRHAWHLFIIKLHLSHLKIDRDKLIHLMAARGIECGVHFKPIFELSYYRDSLGLSGQYFPNAAYAGQRVVSLPLYAGLKLSEVDRVCDALSGIVKKHSK